jgi:hypothetical protein
VALEWSAIGRGLTPVDWVFVKSNAPRATLGVARVDAKLVVTEEYGMVLLRHPRGAAMTQQRIQPSPPTKHAFRRSNSAKNIFPRKQLPIIGACIAIRCRAMYVREEKER